MATDCPIFISYRRADLSLEAEWLHALISSFFGEGVAFLDRREITAGATPSACAAAVRLPLVATAAKDSICLSRAMEGLCLSNAQIHDIRRT